MRKNARVRAYLKLQTITFLLPAIFSLSAHFRTEFWDYVSLFSTIAFLILIPITVLQSLKFPMPIQPIRRIYIWFSWVYFGLIWGVCAFMLWFMMVFWNGIGVA